MVKDVAASTRRADRSIDQAETVPTWIPLRLSISDDRRADLRELRETFRGWYKAGGFPAFRFQDVNSRSKYIDKVFSTFEERQFPWSTKGGPDGVAAFAYAASSGIEQEDVEEAFGRLGKEIGLVLAFPHDFTCVFEFLSGVLTFPPNGIRPGRRNYTEPCDNIHHFKPDVRRGAPIFDPHETDTLRPNLGISIGVVDLENGPWQALHGTYIEDVAFAACEALDAILDGRLAQRRFPFACPWSYDPFNPPKGGLPSRFIARWGWELAESQEQLAHVLRTFFVPDDSPDAANRESPHAARRSARSLSTDEVSFSDDYLSANWYGERHRFTPKQALIVRKLHDAYRKGHPEVTCEQLRHAADSTSPVRSLFDGHRAWKSMIVPVERHRGRYRLAIRDDSSA